MNHDSTSKNINQRGATISAINSEPNHFIPQADTPSVPRYHNHNNHNYNHSGNDVVPTAPGRRLSVELIRNKDGSALLDHRGQAVPVGKYLATKPLKGDILTRPGPGGRKLSYMTGECISRTLNETFGYDGWCLEVKDTKQVVCEKDGLGRYNVAYTSIVRVIHKVSGTFKEDCGAGDAVDKSIGTAIAHAMKAAVTDGMKRKRM